MSDSQTPTMVKVDGVSAVSVPLDAGQGGLLLPIPEAIVSAGQGTVAIRVSVAGFPSNATVLDFGGGKSGRLIISESCAGGEPQRGHFRLVVLDASGKQAVDAPVGDAGRSYNLAVTWEGGAWTLWVDGKSIGSAKGKIPWQAMPERLALVEPIGVRWERVEVWSRPLADDQIQALVTENLWTLDTNATFLANREEKQEAAQTGVIGPGLMTSDQVMEGLQKPVPRRMLFVDALKGKDDGDGSAGQPFQTIGAAAQVAGPGDTVTVLPGTYRECVALTHSGRKNAPIVFQASPEGPVILDGTDPIVGFRSGSDLPGASLWVKDDFNSRDTSFGDAAYRQRLVAQGQNGLGQMERRGRIDTIWVDGQLLPKAESRETLRPYSFWVDPDKKELTVALEPGDRPENHRLEIGARGAFFSGNVSYIVLSGFRAVGADTSTIRGAAIELGLTSSNWTIEDIDESGGNWAGILIEGWGHVLRHCVADNNGDEGIAGSLCQYLVMDSDRCDFNNWQRGINPSWEAGGSKFTGVDHLMVRNQETAFNLGPGFWFDCNNLNVTIEGGRFHDNGGDGICAEISTGPFIFRNNVCYDNEEAGIGIDESSNVLVQNNTLVGNKYGIELRNIPNRTGLYGQAAHAADAGATWKVANVEINRNIIAQNLTAGLINTFAPIDVVQDKIVSDDNLFFKNKAMAIWPLKPEAGVATKLDASNDWVPAESGGGIELLSLDEVHKALGLEQNSVEADPKFRMPTLHEYQVDMSGPAGTQQEGYEFTTSELSAVNLQTH